MKVLVLGSGGREHALSWKITRSPQVEEVICAPGNAGIAGCARCVPLDLADQQAVAKLATDEGVGLVVVGPEAPLVDGLGDRLRSEGFPVFGPSAAAAQLEGSKAFAKLFMARHGVPTARFQVFDHIEPLLGFLASTDEPVVVKADGLAAGKGVILCHDREEAARAARQMMVDGAFGEAGNRVVVETLLRGEEVSYLALVSGQSIVPLVSSQDHKALLAEEDRPFAGLLYAGLMVTDEGPQVLEFNVRFGDPETQPLMALLDEDIVPALLATADGSLSSGSLRWKEGSSCCVVMAAGGYPGSYEKGHPIEGLGAFEGQEELVVFHAGTARQSPDGPITTAGGRVLGVTAVDHDFPAARDAAYTAVGEIRWPGVQYRTDIGHRALARLGGE
jgi:phosphoribosylamine--glycine ligase